MRRSPSTHTLASIELRTACWVAGRTADRFGSVQVSAIWFVLTACGALLLRTHLSLGIAYTVVFVTGVWLFSAQTMVYATTAPVYE